MRRSRHLLLALALATTPAVNLLVIVIENLPFRSSKGMSRTCPFTNRLLKLKRNVTNGFSPTFMEVIQENNIDRLPLQIQALRGSVEQTLHSRFGSRLRFGAGGVVGLGGEITGEGDLDRYLVFRPPGEVGEGSDEGFAGF
ncbi:hypothetical protein C8R41DRAFT_822698 [Lentinula lateritia]|uniref:Uncharacterized protein n=1 Tax=Lentinula lateritia TaxID=40482 RepID=A0ABQ8VNV5_9AGAR|nr:hypothetical protein C8R41DRAFT_822698 [Lentinula lateritia]